MREAHANSTGTPRRRSAATRRRGAGCTSCSASAAPTISRSRSASAAYVSLAAEASTGGRITGLLERGGQKSAEGLASVKQQAAHQPTTARSTRRPSPGARPGTVAALLVSCVTIGGGAATYCAQHNVDPLSAATRPDRRHRRGIQTAEADAARRNAGIDAGRPSCASARSRRTATSSEPPPSSEPEPQPAAEPEPGRPRRRPNRASNPPRPTIRLPKPKANTTAPESAPAESARPAPVSGGGAPQFGGP